MAAPAGDEALESGDAKGAISAYTSALDGVAPDVRRVVAAAAAPAKASSPPKLTGLPPSRLKDALAKERERTMPGNIRWLFEALVGRCRARLALGSDDLDSALADAREATVLCPLAPSGWAALAAAAEATSDAELATQAKEEMRQREPL